MNISYSASAEFLRAFFGPTTEHNVEIRSLPQEHGGGPNRPRFTRDTEIACEHLVKWDQPGRACYFGACTRITGKASGTRADCAELPGLWVDIDCEKQSFSKSDAVGAALSLPLRPSLLVDSGGGIHGYWLLREAMDVRAGECNDDDIIAVLRQLAGVLAGDPAVCDIARVMRLPGTFNHKYGSPRLCSLLLVSDFSLRYEFGDLVEMLDVQRPVLRDSTEVVRGAIEVDNDPFLAQMARLPFKPPVDVDQKLRDMAFGIKGRSIDATRCSVSSSLIAKGVDEAQIFDLLMAATQRAAADAGVALAWNWKREEKFIWRDMASAKVKFAPKNPPKPIPERQGLQVIDGGLEGNTAIAITPLPVAQRTIARNDRGNAQLLIEDHGKDIRYVLGIGWHVWDGLRYCHDPEKVEIGKRAHSVHGKLLAAAHNEKALKWAIQCGNSARLSNMAHEARSYVYSDNASLDADAFLLNCLNGTLNLKTGGLGLHSQADLITKLIPLDYSASALCPEWDAFLLSIFGGDADLVDFLQRCVGYSLTGDCREQVIFILHGLGSNGKSVLIETLSALLADYVRHCPSETFMSRQAGGIPNDLAALVGARFVSVVETEHGRGLAEGLVKQATGGDAMTVRFLHKEFFSFIPKFKLWLATNHKPVIRGSDLAIWRRIRLLPFGETFVDADKATEGQKVKDPDLKGKLLDELPGILAWAVRGCSEWQIRGLVVPKAVENATRLYQESQSPVTKFITECCSVARACQCEAGELYEAYTLWCDDLDEEVMSKKRFGMTLDEQGYAPYKSGYGGKRMRKGIDITLKFRQTMVDARAVRADEGED